MIWNDCDATSNEFNPFIRSHARPRSRQLILVSLGGAFTSRPITVH
jgi:hypothetical protein